MANHTATQKSLRKNARRQFRHKSEKSAMRTLIKQVRTAVNSNNKDEARMVLRKAISALDTAAKKHVIHPRNASRRKARLMHLVDTMNASAE